MITVKKITRTPKVLEIGDITLLSRYEFEVCKDNIKPIDEEWWLRSSVEERQGVVNQYALADYVNYDNYVSCTHVNVYHAVRPALKINLEVSEFGDIGDSFIYKNEIWTIISENLALCDRPVGRYYFNEEIGFNNYKKSDIKKFLDDFLSR